MDLDVMCVEVVELVKVEARGWCHTHTQTHRQTHTDTQTHSGSTRRVSSSTELCLVESRFSSAVSSPPRQATVSASRRDSGATRHSTVCRRREPALLRDTLCFAVSSPPRQAESVACCCCRPARQVSEQRLLLRQTHTDIQTDKSRECWQAPDRDRDRDRGRECWEERRTDRDTDRSRECWEESVPDLEQPSSVNHSTACALTNR